MDNRKFSNVREVISQLSNLVGGVSVFGTEGLGGMSQKQIWKKYDREISVHAKGYILPKICMLRPNENEASKENRLLNYEPITTPFWNEALSKMKRILLASTADVRISEKTEEFVRKEQFDGFALYDFFSTNMVERTINDPNGLTVIYPLAYAEKEKINPVSFVRFSEIVYLDKNTAVFLYLPKSEYRYSYDGKMYNEGVTYDVEHTLSVQKPVYHIFVNGQFAEVLDRNEDAKEWKFDEYKTNLDFLPCFQNGGIKVSNFVFKSFFHSAIHFGNKALNRASDNDAVDSMYSYPITEMASEECNTCHGVGRVKQSEPTTAGFPIINEVQCETCKGVGELVIMSPYKTMLRKRAESNTDPLDTNRESIRFYSPDVAILTHSAQNWKDYLELFKKNLHVMGRRDTNGVESGYSIEKQFEPLYDFMHDVGLTLYNNLEYILRVLQAYIDPNNKNFGVSRPISYHLVEEGEAFSILAAFLEKDMPPLLRRQNIRNFTSKYMGINSLVLRYLQILEEIDPFLYYTTQQKQDLLLAGGLNKRQFRLSISAFGVMAQIFADETFKDADKNQIKTEILKRVNEFEVDVIAPIV